MNKQEQERLFDSMDELNDMLVDIEREVGKLEAAVPVESQNRSSENEN